MLRQISVTARQMSASAILAVLLLDLTGCATTINVSAPTTVDEQIDKIILAGTSFELLEQLHGELEHLSQAMTDQDHVNAKASLSRVTSIWQVLEQKLVDVDDQLRQDIQRVVNLASNSVERTRPADADKALRFLQIVLDQQK